MKKYFTLILLALLPIGAHAYDAKIDGIYYDFSGNEATVTFQDCNRGWYSSDYSGTINIPVSVTYNNSTYNVTSIGIHAFEHSTPTSVTIPNSVTSIGDHAFEYSGLTSITIPNSVTSIGRNALSTQKLEKVVILDIAAWCNISFQNNIFQSGDFYHQFYLNDQEIKNLVIPDGVTEISNYAFYGCSNLESVTIPESVTAIGESSFANCISLTYVSIPNSVTTIGSGAFSGCSELPSAIIPEGLTSISSCLFYDCYSLKTVYLPASITSIGSQAFAYDSNKGMGPGLSPGIKCLPFLKDIYCPASVLPKLNKSQSYYNDMSGRNITYDTYLFGAIQSNQVTLHVLSNLIPDYSASSVWNQCKNIVPMDHTITYLIDGELYMCDTLLYMSTITPATSPQKEGYTFSGWKDLPDTMPDGDVVVTGSFDINSYSITYKVDGVDYKIYSITYGSEITPEEAPTKDGFTFTGWSEIPETMPAHDVIVTGSFVSNNYTLTYIVNGQEYKSYSIAFGSSIASEEAPTKEGYTFSGWSEIPKTMPAHDVIIIGFFTINQYSIFFNTNGGSSVESITQDFNSVITPPEDPQKDGYTFKGWEPAIPETMPVDGLTCVAQWQVNSYALTYIVDGQKCKTDSIAYGTEITPEFAPTKEGYTFSGWSEIPAIMPAYDVTVTGSFTINQYTISFNTNGGSFVECITQDYSSAIIPPADPIKVGYTFIGWEPEIPETMPAGDLTCVAQWQVNSYALTYIVDGQEYKVDSIAYGMEITPEPAPIREGYTFSGWSYIPGAMPAADVVVMGTFSINSYALTYMVDGEEYKTSTVVYGSEITPEAEPTKEGYTFSGWSEIPENMPAGDVVVTGSFIPNSYTLSYIVDGEEYKTSSVTYGTAITPEAEPTKEGYTFSGWSEIPNTMPAEDVTVTGSFTINQYLLTYILEGEEYKSYEIDFNTALTPEPAPTKKGMTFSGWGDVPETMPAHDVTLTGSYTWSKEIVDGIVYQVADTLSNYASVVGYEGTGEEVTILSDVLIGEDVYAVNNIAENALQKTTTIYVSVGRLLLWLWTNGYEDIRDTDSGRCLPAPEISLEGKTASSLSLSYKNDYPQFSETITLQGSPVEKGKNGYDLALKGLEPDKLYEGLATLTLTYEEASYSKSFSFKTEPLTLTTQQPKIISLGNVIVAATSNLDDAEMNVGFEWRRTDWTDDFASNFGKAYLYKGTMEGYIRNLYIEKLWKYRPYYESNDGKRYYGNWVGIDPTNTSYFMPTVHTYSRIDLTGNLAKIWGYVMRGTDNITMQGFIYWSISSTSSSRRNANGIPSDTTKVLATGNVMSATLEDLDYDTEYCYMAFVTTSEGETFYGEPQTFKTSFDPDGIEEIVESEEVTEVARYDIQGRMISKPQKGINIVRYSDGTTRKVIVKQ